MRMYPLQKPKANSRRQGGLCWDGWASFARFALFAGCLPRPLLWVPWVPWAQKSENLWGHVEIHFDQTSSSGTRASSPNVRRFSPLP